MIDRCIPRGAVCGAVLCAALSLAGARLTASGDGFGGLCLIEKVVIGQDEGQRPSAQVWGTCVMSTPGGTDDRGNYVFASYGEPRHGYLYYFAPKAFEQAAAKEWLDLKQLAGTGEVVGIGSSQLPNRLRWADEKPQSPNEYPTQIGLVKVTTNPVYAKLVAALKKAADGK